MNHKSNALRPLTLVLLVLSLCLCIGVRVLFHACAQGENGWMTCHWAEQAVFGLGIVLTVQALLLLALGQGGIALSMIPTAVLTVALPGRLIPLCMMADMRCNAMMRPAVTLLGVAIAIAAALCALLTWRRS